MMKVLSWNCHYEFGKKEGLTNEKTELIMQFGTDVLLIQECTKQEFDRMKRSFKFRNWYNDDREDSVLGTAIFSNNWEIAFPERFNRNFRYVIPYTLKRDERELALYSVWIKAPFDGSGDYAKILCDAMKYYQPKSNALVMGDFNVGANTEHPERYAELIRELGRLGLRNAAEGTANEYANTHWNMRTANYYQNDYCFCTRDIPTVSFTLPEEGNWISEGNAIAWAGLSDHCPICAEIPD